MRKEYFFERLENSIGQFIPEHISDDTVINVLEAMSKFKKLDEADIKEHKKHNEIMWDKYVEKHRSDIYIENQNEMACFLYGKQNDKLSKILLDGKNINASYNSCEVIAVYNALISLCEEAESIPLLIEKFEKKGIVLDGYFGTSVYAMKEYFDDLNFYTKLLTDEKIDEKNVNRLSREYTTYILTTYNNKKNIYDMIHTINISKERNGFVMHNSGDGKIYDTLMNVVLNYNKGGGEPISLLGINCKKRTIDKEGYLY